MLHAHICFYLNICWLLKIVELCWGTYGAVCSMCIWQTSTWNIPRQHYGNKPHCNSASSQKLTSHFCWHTLSLNPLMYLTSPPFSLFLLPLSWGTLHILLPTLSSSSVVAFSALTLRRLSSRCIITFRLAIMRLRTSSLRTPHTANRNRKWQSLSKWRRETHCAAGFRLLSVINWRFHLYLSFLYCTKI